MENRVGNDKMKEDVELEEDDETEKDKDIEEKVKEMMMPIAEIMRASNTMLDAGEVKAGRNSGPVERLG